MMLNIDYLLMIAEEKRLKTERLMSKTSMVFGVMLFLVFSLQGRADSRCIPFFKNFTAKEYNAHNRNFDIACDDYGTVFVANFEGLIYYDGASWRKIHTPGISRVTRIAKGNNGRIWVGGYNVFGYLKPDAQGRLQLIPIISDASKGGLGEIDFIKPTDDRTYFHSINGKSYYVDKSEKVHLLPASQNTIFTQATDSVTSLKLPTKCVVKYNHTEGILFHTTDNPVQDYWAPLSEEKGLISNTINFITFNNGQFIWGATDKGIFAVEVLSPYGIINEAEGLKGEVNSVIQTGNTVYVGTMEGIFRIKGNTTQRLADIDIACWQLAIDGNQNIYAATTNGLYRIKGDAVTQLTNGNTLSVLMAKTGNGLYTGEFDGIYYTTSSGSRRLISQQEKVTSLSLDGSNLLAETIYGEQWQISTINGSERCLRQKADISNPKVKITDPFGTIWTTDNNGRGLKAISKNRYAKVLEPWLAPFKQRSINALHISKAGDIWIGGDFGLIYIDGKKINSISTGKPLQPYIREITAMGDSVIWGGYGSDMKPLSVVKDVVFPPSCKNITITMSPKGMSIVQPTLYRYRTNGGRWSAWSDDQSVEFNNPFYGTTLVEVQTMDLFGRISEPCSVEWYIQFPIYMRWWALLIYLIIIIYGITQFYRWRTNRLKRDKEKLEGIVAERTSELSAAYTEQQKMTGQLQEAYTEQQKMTGQLQAAYTEQQKISAELSDTLDDLKRTQNDLVRMERTATAGKLTQGLIDRILNPINYINNFSKLTSGLAKDLQEDIEDEKDNMSEDNYEDCEDILDMMTQNLQKIEEHGVNTTRTLRAMEAMLNNHVGTLSIQDISPLCRQAAAVTTEYFKDDISRCGISIRTMLPETPVMVNMDAESMIKVLLSLLTNSVYAIVKKFSQAAYPTPEIIITIQTEGDNAIITIHDNGIGIEDTIQEKVFDPFFTTKPTGEAAGVGLYLVRELIHDHDGEITLRSEKGEYCEFTISLRKA